MLDGSKVIPLGPVAINFNGADLGHTDETGATAKTAPIGTWRPLYERGVDRDE